MKNKTPMRFQVGHAVGCLLAAVLLGGCGSGDDGREPVVGPLPTGAEDPRAYTEGFMSENPLALAQLGHLLVVELEPTSTEDRDTCTDTSGVDCVPYIVEEPTLVELSIAEDVTELAELVLVDASRTVVLRHSHGDQPSTVLLDPDSYRLELHHAFAGDPAAAVQMIFLLPEFIDDAQPGASDPATQPIGAGATGAPPTARLSAQKNCVRCNFSNALLEEENFDGLELTGAIFNGARIRATTFRGAKIADGRFLDFTSIGATTTRGTSWEMASIDADFTGAVLSRAQFSLRTLPVAGWHFSAVFRGAQLDSTVWKGRPQTGFQHLLNADFRNADLTDSRWEEQLTLPVRASPPKTPQCTFQGADLTRAKFSGSIKERLSQCRFDKETQSGRVTVLNGADLTGANVSKAAMSDADLTEAILDRTIMEGTDLTRATLSGATTSGVRWRGAILTDAVITDITTLDALDLTETNLMGVDFAGLDLSHADLSKAVLDAAPKFAGATFTDGTRGMNVSGHRFAERYAAFKGADLTRADLSHTELFQADLEGTTLNNANLVGANLNFSSLRRAKLRGATLGIQPGTEGEAASLRSAFMPDIDLSDADLRSVNLNAAHLYGESTRTLLVRTRLDSANFSNAICSGAHFSGSLNNTVFTGAQLVNAVFNGATLTETKFDDAYLQGADFSNAVSVTGVSLSNAAVSATAGTWQFKEQNGAPYPFRYGATQLGPLANNSRVRCPNGTFGPCCPNGDLAACLNNKLDPVGEGPHPPVPTCVPAFEYCFENCKNPPNFNRRPPCR